MDTTNKLEIGKKLKVKYNKSVWKMKDTELPSYTVTDLEPSDGEAIRLYESGTNLKSATKRACRLYGIKFKDYEVEYIEEPRVISSR